MGAGAERAGEGLVPLQGDAQIAARRHGDRGVRAAGAEVVEIDAGRWIRIVAARVAVPERLVDAAIARVGGGGQEQRAIGDGGVHRLGDDAVLEHRLGEEEDVVDDHVGAAGAQGGDVLGERRLVGQSGREEQRGAGGEIVHHLAHAAPLVAAAARAGIEHHDGWWQVARLLRRGAGQPPRAAVAGQRPAERVADGVGQQANADAAAVDAGALL